TAGRATRIAEERAAPGAAPGSLAWPTATAPASDASTRAVKCPPVRTPFRTAPRQTRIVAAPVAAPAPVDRNARSEAIARARHAAPARIARVACAPADRARPRPAAIRWPTGTRPARTAAGAPAPLARTVSGARRTPTARAVIA